MEPIVVRAMKVDDLHTHMMDEFNRYQEITHILRKNGRTKKLRRPRVEDWTAGFTKGSISNFIYHVYFRQYFGGEPKVSAAFRGDQVVGFAHWRFMEDLKLKRSKQTTYAILDRLFVSQDCRRMGLGKQLFGLCARAAKAEGASMLSSIRNPRWKPKHSTNPWVARKPRQTWAP